MSCNYDLLACTLSSAQTLQVYLLKDHNIIVLEITSHWKLFIEHCSLFMNLELWQITYYTANLTKSMLLSRLSHNFDGVRNVIQNIFPFNQLFFHLRHKSTCGCLHLLFQNSQWRIMGLMIVKAKKANLDQNPTEFLSTFVSRSLTLRFSCWTWRMHFLVSDISFPM